MLINQIVRYRGADSMLLSNLNEMPLHELAALWRDMVDTITGERTEEFLAHRPPFGALVL
jgi:hypothetical protein